MFKHREDRFTVSTVKINDTNNGSDDDYPSEDYHPNFNYSVPTDIPYGYEGGNWINGEKFTGDYSRGSATTYNNITCTP